MYCTIVIDGFSLSLTVDDLRAQLSQASGLSQREVCRRGDYCHCPSILPKPGLERCELHTIRQPYSVCLVIPPFKLKQTCKIKLIYNIFKRVLK